MADIRPFQAIRPAKGLEARTAALPYDVYSREEAYVQAARDRMSFLNIDRPETQFEASADMYAPEVYEKARDMIEERLAKGELVQDREKMYYLYEMTMEGRTQTGLVACASIDDYRNRVIREHENTRADKEQDRICHVDVCSMQTGPVFLAYARNEEIQRIIAKVRRAEPYFDFVSSDGVRQRGWCIAQRQDIEAITEKFREIRPLYIADGHHRAASSVKVGMKRRRSYRDYDGTEEFNYFLAVLFPHDELKILDYNRAVKDLNGLSQEEFLTLVSKRFEIRKCTQMQKPQEKGTFSMFLADGWYLLRFRSEYRKSDPVGCLDVSVLQNEILGPILGITDPKNDPRITFIGGIRGLEELERRVQTDCAAAFALYPTSIEELFAVADADLLMPPKSTWFEPKLRSGLFLHKIEKDTKN